jgi:hypothetical protein
LNRGVAAVSSIVVKVKFAKRKEEVATAAAA